MRIRSNLRLRPPAKFVEPEVGWAIPEEGRDGWMFLRGDTNNALGQHTGRVVPDRGWERQWKRLWRRRARLMRDLGAAHVQLAVPDKETIYSDIYAEILPEGMELVPRRPIHRLLELAPRAGIDFIYPLEELRAVRKTWPVYAKTDSHWTAPSAYVAYRRICETLGRRGVRLPVVSEDEFDYEEFEFTGDLGAKFDPPRGGTGIRARVRDRRARLVADNRIRVTGRQLVFESERSEAPRIVVFGTSSVVGAVPFLSESASRLVWLHTAAVVEELLLEERPDVVIVVSAERVLLRPPVDRRAGEMLAEVVAQKVQDGVTAEEGDLQLLGVPPFEG